MVKRKGEALLTFGDRIFLILVELFLLVFLLVTLFPLVYIFSSSLSSGSALMAGRVWLLPVEPTVRAYVAIFADDRIVTGFLNTFFYTSFGTAINVVLTLLAGYALSRKDLSGRNIYMFLFVFTMYFSGGLIPTYLLVRNLGMINTRWAMVLPQALSVWNVIITRTFFQANVPTELLESAQLDGCTDTRFFLHVVMPISTAITAVNVLFYAVGHWNSFFDALIYLYDDKLYPLQLVLRAILVNNQVSANAIDSMDIEIVLLRQYLAEILKFALIVVATLPIISVYPFVQKYFIKGVMLGSLKG